MHDSLGVRRFECLGDLPGDRQRFTDWQCASSDPVREVLALDQFHHERRDRAALIEAVDAGDERVVQ